MSKRLINLFSDNRNKGLRPADGIWQNTVTLFWPGSCQDVLGDATAGLSHRKASHWIYSDRPILKLKRDSEKRERSVYFVFGRNISSHSVEETRTSSKMSHDGMSREE